MNSDLLAFLACGAIYLGVVGLFCVILHYRGLQYTLPIRICLSRSRSDLVEGGSISLGHRIHRRFKRPSVQK
jgi:hypothetical protein